MHELDYSALHEPLRKEDYLGIPNDPTSKLNKVGIVCGMALGLFCLVIVLLVGFDSISHGNGSGVLIGGLMCIVFLFAVGYWFVYELVRRRKRLARLTKFSRMNQAHFDFDRMPIGYEGLLFDNGHSRTKTEAIKFPNGFEIGNYRYVTGSGKHQRTHSFGYARVALTRHLPNMVLDARLNNFLGVSNLPDTFHRSQRLSLEGDFNKHFDVYVPEGYERDALYVFTPDVMQTLIDEGKNYDLEIVGNELYVYTSHTLNLISEVEVKKLVGIVGAISKELRDQTKRYSDERVMGAAAGTVVAPQGRRLKGRFSIVSLAFVAMILYFVVLPNILPAGAAQITSMIVFGGLVVMMVVAGIRKIR